MLLLLFLWYFAWRQTKYISIYIVNCLEGPSHIQNHKTNRVWLSYRVLGAELQYDSIVVYKHTKSRISCQTNRRLFELYHSFHFHSSLVVVVVVVVCRLQTVSTFRTQSTVEDWWIVVAYKRTFILHPKLSNSNWFTTQFVSQ